MTVVVEGLKIVLCYFRPNTPMREFNAELDALEDIRRGWNGPILFCGDFNAKSPAWGSRKTDRRGALILELLARIDVYPVRAGGCPYTFINGRGHTAVLDFAFCDAATLRRLRSTEVLVDETRSDHQYVLHTLYTPNTTMMPPPFRWNPKTLEVERMKEAYDARVADLHPNRPREEADVQEYLDVVEKTCADSMSEMRPPKRPTTVGTAGRTPELREMRREANRRRRRKQRAYQMAPEILAAR